MKKQQVIMLDMDDVMVINGVQKMIEDFFGAKFELNESNYYLQDQLGARKDEFFYKFFKDKNLYDYVDIPKDCIEVLEKITKNYKVYICTSYIWKGYTDLMGDNLKNKYNFLLKFFPFIDPYDFIFISAKQIMNCDIRIDDRVDNLTGSCKKILYTAYHNKNIIEKELKEQGIKRVNNWKEIEKMLL